MSGRHLPATPSTEGSPTPTYALPTYSFPTAGGGGGATPFLAPGGANARGGAPLEAALKALRGELQTLKEDDWQFEAPRHQHS
ncbi:hypothetical protein Rsub_11810 [Raphidocelis subcapitata]|uniref:Uncharacterized protein n=1 Tax=Raphidocelis subcapitata TaxID=307507 RepID=A0A2V0PGW7_9CHLO|nr:hypothetical protein Rsub_11810 [Raphidocelis subcapitata]|eukprot:GBF99006.1 hypothetical protein Rsub_11810 [Raphidocelis subcapitata]